MKFILIGYGLFIFIIMQSLGQPKYLEAGYNHKVVTLLDQGKTFDDRPVREPDFSGTVPTEPWHTRKLAPLCVEPAVSCGFQIALLCGFGNRDNTGSNFLESFCFSVTEAWQGATFP
ncbi:MAG: hypothetical protein RBT68_14565 [Spirochaetia bacterium]|nr:hypothetical protein [Spirochaetia bacterium]